jgi:2-dehydro-3-deoxyphosphogluconate aldolase/(4S)-4-hydroxy-2-oxoglutarate aldolase
MVKVFPASVGGPPYIKAIRGPLPQVKLVPVGGVNLNTTADFIRAGAEIVGVGGSLINQKLLEAKEFDKISESARQYREEVRKGREG